MTFDELFAGHNLSPDERQALVLHLAALRMAATLRAFGITGAGTKEPGHG